MNSIDELAALVRAGLDEDERAARAARPGPWINGASKPHLVDGVVYGESVWPAGNLSHTCDTGYAGKYGTPNAEHIVRHDPARVLAEVAAKRSLLNDALAWVHNEVEDPWYCCPASPAYAKVVQKPGPCECARDERVRLVLMVLAAPYRERP